MELGVTLVGEVNSVMWEVEGEADLWQYLVVNSNARVTREIEFGRWERRMEDRSEIQD